MNRIRTLDGVDWSLLGVTVSLLFIGVITIYSVTSNGAESRFPIFAKQCLWIGIGTLAFVTVASMDYHKLARLSYILYGLGLILLVIVMISGKTSRGAQRWISLGPVAIQPSEFIKLPLLLMLSVYYTTQTQRLSLIHI